MASAETFGTIPAGSSTHRGTVLVFVCMTETSKPKGKDVKTYLGARDQREDTLEKSYCGIRLKLFPPGSPNIINSYSTAETKCQNNPIFKFGEL